MVDLIDIKFELGLDDSTLSLISIVKHLHDAFNKNNYHHTISLYSINKIVGRAWRTREFEAVHAEAMTAKKED